MKRVGKMLGLPVLARLAGLVVITQFVADAQTLLMRVRSGDTVQLVTPGGSATTTAPAVGIATPLQVSVSYEGAATATLVRGEVVGSRDFAVLEAPTFPRSVRSGEEVVWQMRFLPTSGARSEIQFAITLREASNDGGVLAQTVSTFSIAGIAPDLTIAAVTEGGNLRPLQAGEGVTLPETAVGETTVALMAIANRGSAPAQVESIALEAPQFQLVQLPILPARVEPGGEIRFGIQYRPREAGQHAATVRTRVAGRDVAIPVAATARTVPQSQLRYFLVRDGERTPVLPDTTVTIPNVPVNQRSTAVIRVENTGSTEVTEAVLTEGGPFSLVEGPTLLSLRPGSARELTIVFSPMEVGDAEGTLRIGSDRVRLRATGLGTGLVYRYGSDGAFIDTAAGGRVLLPGVPLGSGILRRFVIENRGNQPAVVPAVTLTALQPGFTLEDVPALPLTLEAGESTSFAIRFRPSTVGSHAASLLVGSAVFDITASGERPPALPAYEIATSLERGEPARQGFVTLRLAEPYPLPLMGALLLQVTPNGVTPDPAAQFATGGRIVGFRIPGNTRDAVFEGMGTQAMFQTGTVTATLTFTPSFSTVNDIDVTPEAPATTSLFIPLGPPVLVGVRMVDVTSTGFEVVINGRVTSRSLSRVNVQLLSATGVELDTTIDVSQATRAWFGNPTSELFGGSFSLAIPFSSPRPAVVIRNVRVSAENELGRSNTVSSAPQ